VVILFDNDHPIIITEQPLSSEDKTIQANIDKLYQKKLEDRNKEKKEKQRIKEEEEARIIAYELEYKTSSFKNIPGGKYLFDIYAGNYNLIMIKADEYLQNFRNEYKKMDAISKMFFAGLSPENSSMLNLVLMEYMHEYKKNKENCFKDGAKTYTINKTTEKFQIGNDSYVYGGDELIGIYKINKEFVEICKRSAGVRNLSNGIWANHELVIGTQKLRESFDCDSKEIKQFERNLINFYKKFFYKE